MKNSLGLRVLPAAGASAVLGLVVALRPLDPIARGIAIGCVIGAWIAPFFFKRSDVRAHASVVAAIAGVTAAGQVATGLFYGVACALFLIGCLLSMQAARATPHADRPARASRPALAILFATAAVVATGLVVSLPRLAARIEQRINAMFEGEGDEATAFSTTMVLGSTRGMLQSDAIVMRIDGERPEYLRGAVYDRYDGRYWIASGAGRDRKVQPAAAPPESATTRITLVRGAPNGNDMRWFLPAGACDFRVTAGTVEVDPFGVVRRGRGDDPPTLAYRTAGCASPGPSVLPPTQTDTDIRTDVRKALAPIAASWTAGAATDRSKLEAIQRELGRFEYSLAVPRTNGLDPVVDFLTVHRAGHCEMFASAMVLLARTQGISARVVGGYHVREVNPLTGRAVVRDRNAHAWVEAWVDGAWRGFDPTPVGESFGRTTSTFDNLGDLASSVFERIALFFTRLGALGTAAVLAAIIALLLVIRSIGRGLRTRRARRGSAAASAPPLPCFETLTEALAVAGHPREESEPVEAFARRLANSAAPWAKDASKALLAYAGLRYGGIGDEAAIVRDVDKATRAVHSTTR